MAKEDDVLKNLMKHALIEQYHELLEITQGTEGMTVFQWFCRESANAREAFAADDEVELQNHVVHLSTIGQAAVDSLNHVNVPLCEVTMQMVRDNIKRKLAD